MSDMTPEMLEEAKAHIEDLRIINSWSRGDLLLIDALAHIDALQRTIEQKEAEVAQAKKRRDAEWQRANKYEQRADRLEEELNETRFACHTAEDERDALKKDFVTRKHYDEVVDALKAEVARLREIITNAPHRAHCTGKDNLPNLCDCWKREALTEALKESEGQQ